MCRALSTCALLALASAGCGEAVLPLPISVRSSPASVLNPQPAAPTPARDATAPAKAPDASARPPAPSSRTSVTKVDYNAFLARVAANPSRAKYTLVDVWATTCGPCMENFPHLVEMHRKLSGRGLAVASLSLDERDDVKALERAGAFLAEKGADFPNYLMDEEAGVGFEKLGVSAIPAVLLFGPDGKLVRRYTMDDPDDQFTYVQVEAEVTALLDGKPRPALPASR